MAHRSYWPGLVFFATGCMFLPSATTKPVREADLIGTWRYEAHPRENRGVPENDGVVTLKLLTGGIFEQEVLPAGGGARLTQTGAWKLDGSHVLLDDVLVCDHAKMWSASDVSWRVIDVPGQGHRFAIFGGDHPDPDSHHEFERIP